MVRKKKIGQYQDNRIPPNIVTEIPEPNTTPFPSTQSPQVTPSPRLRGTSFFFIDDTNRDDRPKGADEESDDNEGTEENFKMATNVDTAPEIDYLLDRDLEDILRDTFGIRVNDHNHELLQALAYDSITSWKTFRRLRKDAIESFTKETHRQARVQIGKSIRTELYAITQAIQRRINLAIEGDEPMNIKCYTSAMFEEYIDRYYKEKQDLIGDLPNVSSTPAAGTSYKKSKTEKDLDSWDRRRNSKTNFEILREDSKYKLWKETFIPELKVQGLQRLIDPKFNKNKLVDAYDRELFERQSNYFWTVLDYALKNPIADIILGKHRDQSDAHTAFMALDNKMKGKISQMYNVGELMDKLRDLHIATFNGSRVEFVAKWFETLRHLNKVADKEDKLSYIHVRSQLMRAINTDPDLTNSFTELKDEPDRDLALINLTEHLLEKATLFDGRDGVSANTDKKKMITMFHHLGYDVPPELLANRTSRGRGSTGRTGPPSDVKLPDNVYMSFDRDDKIKWRDFSDDAKRSIIAYMKPANDSSGTRHQQAYSHQTIGQGPTQYHDETEPDTDTAIHTIQTLQHSTDAAVNLLTALKSYDYEANATASTTMSSISSQSRPPGTPSNSDSTSKATESNSKVTNRTPTRTPTQNIGRGHPTDIMASKHAQSEDSKKANVSFFGRSAYKHHLCYEHDEGGFHGIPDDTRNVIQTVEYTVSQRRVKTRKSNAMVDRGANGCVGGSDCKIIGEPSPNRRVHITGMDEHQVRNIPICTVGAYAISNRGPVICVFNETAFTGKHQSILSSLQMEHYRNRVDDRVEGLGGGQQITTADGYNFPLSIVNGLPYMQMRPFTTEEYERLPKVIMTSEEKWDPRTYDNYVNPNDSSYKVAKPQRLDLLPYDEYDVKGDYIGANSTDINQAPDFWIHDNTYKRNEYVSRCVHLTRTRSHSRTNDSNEDEVLANQNPRTHEPTEQDYKAMKPYFAWMPTNIIKATFQNSTQYGFMPTSEEGNLFKRWKSPNPAMNVFRMQDDLLTDKIHSNTPSVEGGFTATQLYFGRKSHIIHPEPLSRKYTFLRGLQNFVTKWGAPLKLLADHINYHASFQVLDYLRMLWIPFWFSEAYYQHQNPFERRFQTFKRIVNRTMDRTGTPPELWYLCICYVAYVLNRVADPTLNNRQPIFIATGTVGDISSIVTFQWYEPVYYKKDTSQYTFPDTGESFGFFVGIAETVGHQMTYKIWNPDTKRVVERSIVRSALDIDLINKRAAPEPHQHYTSPNNGEDFKFIPTRPKDFIYSVPPKNSPKTVTTPDDPLYGEAAYLYEEFRKEETSNSTIQYAEDGTPMVVLVDETGNPVTDSEGNAILIPGKEPGELQGITFKQRQDDGSIMRARVIGPVESNLESEEGKRILERFKIKYDRSQVEDTIAYNDLINHIHRDNVEEDGQIWNFRRIISHRGPLNHRDIDYKKSLYNVSIEWENGEITEEPVNWMIKESPVVMAEYARDHNLLEIDGWRTLKPIARRAKLLTRLVKQAKLRSFRTAPKYMYGFQIPRNYEEAIYLDSQNGDTKWADATALEMIQLHEYKVFIDKGKMESNIIPKGFKKIRVHMVFAVKHDGRHKARLVADGHLTDVPLNSVYAGVVSIRGLRICIFLAELNGLEAHATDIGNAYLEAVTEEKVCIKAGPEFGELQGHLLIIYKALYGLRSSGKQFGDLLAACLKELGFKPSLAEPQIFLRRNGDIYEYIATYVDDLCLVMKEPNAFLDVLKSPPYHFKLKGSGPMSFHLGCGFERDSHGTLCMDPSKYIDKLEQAYLQLFGVKLGNRPRSPLEDGDHPELDVSEFLEEDDTLKYQSLIGILQWLITLGRWDIQTAVMTLSSFRAKPRHGHLNRAKRVCAYIKRFRHYVLRFRTEEPDLSDLDGSSQSNWSKDVYEEFQEEIPEDAPEPLGNRVTTIHWFDANLMHDILSGKAVTGCIHYANKTPIMWYSKKQATSETATYGSEFCAGRTCIEQLVDLRNTFRYLGVPLHDISYVFGDNKSMINSATFPYARLHKRHNILSFHYVRSMIARGFIALTHVNSKDNLADVVTKHWGYNSVKDLLKPVFSHAGNTKDLIAEDSDNNH